GASGRLRPVLEWGTGLFAVNDDVHRRHRRLMAPFFTRTRVETYFEEMRRETSSMLRRWTPDQKLDVHREMMNLTVRISARTLLGIDIDTDENLFKAGAESLRLVLSPTVLLAPWDLPGLPYRRFVNAVQAFNSAIRRTIEARRRSSSELSDVLSQLIEA